MKTISIEMPVVSECAAIDCAYNVSRNCHARAITVGDDAHPGCDTFLKSRGHTKAARRTAGIGACKVSACKFNEDFECMTESIRVGDEISCLTYMAR